MNLLAGWLAGWLTDWMRREEECFTIIQAMNKLYY
jgi:hypothetical protein